MTLTTARFDYHLAPAEKLDALTSMTAAGETSSPTNGSTACQRSTVGDSTAFGIDVDNAVYETAFVRAATKTAE